MLRPAEPQAAASLRNPFRPAIKDKPPAQNRLNLGSAAVNRIEMMLKVIGEHTPRSKWTGSPLAPFRQVANTNRGDIGEEFLARYLESFGIPVIRSQSRMMEWDLEIGSKRFVA